MIISINIDEYPEEIKNQILDNIKHIKTTQKQVLVIYIFATLSVILGFALRTLYFHIIPVLCIILDMKYYKQQIIKTEREISAIVLDYEMQRMMSDG